MKSKRITAIKLSISALIVIALVVGFGFFCNHRIKVAKNEILKKLQDLTIYQEIEVIKEVEIETIKKVRIVREVEVIREVPVEVIKEIEIIKEVPVEIIKEKEVIKKVPVEIIKEVEVIKEVPVEIIKKVPVEVIKEVFIETPSKLPSKKEVSDFLKEIWEVGISREKLMLSLRNKFGINEVVYSWEISPSVNYVIVFTKEGPFLVQGTSLVSPKD